LSERIQLLTSLLKLGANCRQYIDLLRPIPQDPNNPIFLQRYQLASIIKRYLGGMLDPSDIEDWAAVVLSRSDIQFPPNHAYVIEDVLQKLADPVSHGRLTKRFARDLLQSLSYREE